MERAPSPALPDLWSLRGKGGHLCLEVRWLTPARVSVALALLAVAVALVGAVAEGHGGRGLRLVLFVTVAVAAYVAAAVALNRTRVRAAGGWLALTHGPLPLPGWGPRGRVVARAQMSQFVVQGRPGRATLSLRLKGGQTIRVAVLPSAEVALGVEAALRRSLESGEAAAPGHIRARGVGLLVTGAYLILTLGLLHRLVLG